MDTGRDQGRRQTGNPCDTQARCTRCAGTQGSCAGSEKDTRTGGPDKHCAPEKARQGIRDQRKSAGNNQKV